jgi:hypothetical protein
MVPSHEIVVRRAATHCSVLEGAKRAQGPVAELHGHTWRRTSSSAAGHGGALELRG